MTLLTEPVVDPTIEGEPLLAVRDLTIRFGEVVANDSVNFEVRAAQRNAPPALASSSQQVAAPLRAAA